MKKELVGNGQRKQANKKKFIYFALVAFFLSMTGWTIMQKNNQPIVSADSGEVLGKEKATKRLYIFRDDQNQGSNGLFSLAKGMEPSIWLQGDNVSGEVSVSVYRGDEDALKNFLVYKDKENGFEKKNDFSNLDGYASVANFSESIANKERRKVILPIAETGVWIVQVKQGDVRTEALLLVSDFSALVKEGDGKLVFWAQNRASGKSLPDVLLTTFNLREKAEKLDELKTNSMGIAEMKIDEKADVAILKNGSDLALIPLNLTSLDYRWSVFKEKVIDPKYFTFTDRPLYRPGDTVHFKSILRNDDDVAYSIVSGRARVSVFSGWGEDKKMVYEKTLTLSEYGAIDDTFSLPPDVEVGEYYLAIKREGSSDENDGYTQANFSVQEFRKPEYSLDIEPEKEVYIVGDEMRFTIKGEYFSGEALGGEKVSYAVKSNNFYEYDYLDSKENALNSKYQYYGGYAGRLISEAEVVLDQNGEAEIVVAAQVPDGAVGNQVVSFEVNFEKGGGEPVFDRKNVLMYAGDFGIYRKSNDWSYAAKIGEKAQIPLTIIPYVENASVKNIAVSATGEREYWDEVRETEDTPLSYKRNSSPLPELKATSDKDGNVTLTFVPDKPGSYQYNVKAVDARGNSVYREVWLWVPEENGFFYSFSDDNEGADQGIIVKADKKSYEPGEKARVTISSNAPNRDVFVSVERGRMDRYQIVSLNGRSKTVEFDLSDVDMPNRFISATTFANGKYYHSEEKILVSAEKKRIDLKIKPDRETYGPGDDISIEVETRDQKGAPLEADVALFGVDKAIYELSDSRNGDIFEEFYRERYNDTQESHSLKGIVAYGAERGGCFAAGTPVLLPDGEQKSIEDIQEGDLVLTRKSETDAELVPASVVSTHALSVNGILIINGDLRVTPIHRMFVNDGWQEAGNIQVGDQLVKADGTQERVDSIEWLRQKTNVYNLTIKDQHTFFARGVWVHNDKGGGGRSVFRDTAYWNPAIRTGADGKARVTFRLPDNLTTWVLASYAETKDSKVGQATKEVKVTKSVILRPILPNIFRIGDEVILSALLQNFSGEKGSYLTNLQFSGGKVVKGTNQKIELNSGESKEIYFTVAPEKELEAAELIFSATGKDERNSDKVTLVAPVYSAGYRVSRSFVGSDKVAANYEFSDDADPEKSTLKVSLAPNLLGTIPDAMEYLVSYPYGCIEQTMSRLVPVVVAQKNKDLYQKALENKDMPELLHKGLLRLREHQLENGGFSWWWKDGADPFISWYVARYLEGIRSMPDLKQEDRNLANEVANKLSGYLEGGDFRWSEQTFVGKNEQEKAILVKERQILRTSGLGYIGNDQSAIFDLVGVRPELLAIAVSHNVKNGFVNPAQNGLSQLLAIQKADPSGGVYWEAGPRSRFGSNDASTAFALQALIAAGDKSGAAEKAARFLANNRQKNYWSNTFATAQVIEAITAFTQKNGGANPNYSYQIFAGEKMIAKDLVNDFRDRKEISISLKDLAAKKGALSVKLSGSGEAYLVAVLDEFRTKKNAAAEYKGIKITREYIPEKGKSNIGIGDTVTVRIKIENQSKLNDYLVIKDELPAGLVPVNREFKNTQGVAGVLGMNVPYGMEIGKADVTFAAYGSNQSIYEYSARVVSAGSFFIPPVQAALMYSPEVYGISETDQLKIDVKSNKSIVGTSLKKVIGDKVVFFILLIFLSLLIGGGISGWLYYNRKQKSLGNQGVKNQIDSFSGVEKAETEKKTDV
ncbi:MAG: MG2 domain-containing protein [Candidatus Moraniibacteriota bacterium]